MGEALTKGVGTLKVKGFSKAPDGGGDGVRRRSHTPFTSSLPPCGDCSLPGRNRMCMDERLPSLARNWPMHCCCLTQRPQLATPQR